MKCWIDASQPGTGNWMKYVRSAPQMDEQNMVPVQVDNKVGTLQMITFPYYKSLLFRIEHNVC